MPSGDVPDSRNDSVGGIHRQSPEQAGSCMVCARDRDTMAAYGVHVGTIYHAYSDNGAIGSGLHGSGRGSVLDADLAHAWWQGMVVSVEYATIYAGTSVGRCRS